MNNSSDSQAHYQGFPAAHRIIQILKESIKHILFSKKIVHENCVLSKVPHQDIFNFFLNHNFYSEV